MIIGNMATYPARESTLEFVLSTIAPQMDKLNLVLNEYQSVPKFVLKHSNIHPIIPPENLRARGKFFPDPAGADYVFLLDDDIVYPVDYTSRSIKIIENINDDNAIFSHHGVMFNRIGFRPTPYWVRDALRYKKEIYRFFSVFHFQHQIINNTAVDMIGTGVSIMRPHHVPSMEYMSGSDTSVDVRLGLWCWERGITPIVLRHDRDWLKCILYNANIYNDHTKQHKISVSKEIWRFAFKQKYRGRIVEDCR